MRCARFSSRTRELVALCTGHIMLFVFITRKWYLSQCYSQMQLVILTTRNTASTTLLPRAVQLHQPPHCQCKGKLSTAAKGTSIGQLAANSKIRVSCEELRWKGRSVPRLSQCRRRPKKNQWRRLLQFSLVKTNATQCLRAKILFETQLFPQLSGPDFH